VPQGVPDPHRRQRTLNFVVVGEVRSGTAAVQSGVSNRPGAVCHADLFHAEATVRRRCHEAYFGACPEPERLPEWFVEGLAVPAQYINHTVFDNPLRGERAVGLRLTYPAVRRWELYDFFESWCREGDFCVVHVTRNPVACLVSLLQAQASGVWGRPRGEPQAAFAPAPISLDAARLTEFCRDYQSACGKVRAAAADRLEVPYQDLFLDYDGVLRRVFDFLELPDRFDRPVSDWRRLRNRSMTDRIANVAGLRREVPADVARFLDAEDLF
jgi:hypothetical protein